MSSVKTEIHEKAAVGFSRGADAYERGRPEYPEAAIHFTDNLMSAVRARVGHPLKIGDLAAGTGKFTKLLASINAREG